MLPPATASTAMPAKTIGCQRIGRGGGGTIGVASGRSGLTAAAAAIAGKRPVSIRYSPTVCGLRPGSGGISPLSRSPRSGRASYATTGGPAGTTSSGGANTGKGGGGVTTCAAGKGGGGDGCGAL